jgi:hypothetical protein
VISQFLASHVGFPVTQHNYELFAETYIVGGKGHTRVLPVVDDAKFGAKARAISTKDVTTGFEKGTLAFGMLILRTFSLHIRKYEAPLKSKTAPLAHSLSGEARK